MSSSEVPPLRLIDRRRRPPVVPGVVPSRPPAATPPTTAQGSGSKSRRGWFGTTVCGTYLTDEKRYGGRDSTGRAATIAAHTTDADSHWDVASKMHLASRPRSASTIQRQLRQHPVSWFASGRATSDRRLPTPTDAEAFQHGESAAVIVGSAKLLTPRPSSARRAQAAQA